MSDRPSYISDIPRQSHIRVNGVDLALFEWPGVGQSLLFVHATGFHARCWDQVIAHLPGRHCYALDLRGHGRSSKPEPPYPWRAFGEDVAALVRSLGFTEVIGIGHSLGGHAVALAAALAPDVFSNLLLIDPVILPQSHYREPLFKEHFAARRRNRWASSSEMFDSFKARRPFSCWEPAVLWDYCNYGLLPAPDGDGFVLACPPQIEASIYMNCTSANIYDEISTIEIPVQVIRAGATQVPVAIDMSASPTDPDLASCCRQGEDLHLPDCSHFIPMEQPALIARHIARF